MKKESLQGFLCLWMGIVVSVFVIACMFKNLHWPGGDLLLAIITPLTLLIQAVSLSCYVLRFGKLKAIEEPAAKHLLRIEIAMLIVLSILFMAIIFRVCHWPFGASLLLISCSALAILSLLAGIFAYIMLNHKK